MIGLTESQLNGRIKVLPMPLLPPSRCMICGAPDRPVLDINFDIDEYGQVYFCLDCAHEMLAIVDAVSPDEVTAEIQSVRQENAQLVEEVNRLNGILGTIESAVSAFTIAGIRSASVEDVEPSSTAIDDSADTIPADASTEPELNAESSEQSTDVTIGEGRSDVSSDSSDGFVPEFRL